MTKLKKCLILFGFKLLLIPYLTSAETLKREILTFRGKALIEVTIFKIDVYEASYRTSKRLDTKLLELTYLMDVERKLSLKGWKEGFKPLDKKVYKEAISWVEENTNDMKKGDVFSMLIDNKKVSLFHNGRFLASSTDPNVVKIIHFPWLGEKPLDEDIKNKLLGK